MIYLPSRLYSIKVEQINGTKWASREEMSLRAIRRFLLRKRRDYGNIKITYFQRVSNDFTLYS